MEIYAKIVKSNYPLFFENRKESTVEEILAQLKSREENADLLYNKYDFAKAFGNHGIILFDENNRKIAILDDTSEGLFGSQRQVDTIFDIGDKNPDIIDYDQIIDVETTITEIRNEEYEMINGERKERESWETPIYNYGINFYIDFTINHPYIKHARIQLNDNALMIRNFGERKYDSLSESFFKDLFGVPKIEDMTEYYEYNSISELISKMTDIFPEYAFGFKVDFRNEYEIKKYAAYLAQSKEIERLLKL